MSRLLQRLVSLARSRGAAVAIEDGRGPVTFQDLSTRALAVAARLQALGLSGRRVGLLTGQTADWVAGFFGALLAGGTAVALSPLHPPAERRRLAAQGRISAVLTTEGLSEGTFTDGTVEVVDLGQLVPSVGGSLGVPDVPPTPDDADALILFTSGTTGRPKGARLSHGNVLSLADTLGKAWGFGPEDCLLHVLPLHHLHGIGISLMVALLSGAKTLMLGRFDPEGVWRRLPEATVLMAVPTQHRRLVEHFEATGGSERDRLESAARGLRLLTSGSAALPETLGRRWEAISGQYPLERYGMTEVGIPLSNPLIGERRPGTVGRVVEGMEVRIVDESGCDVAPGDPGEIWIRGDTVFLGYDGDPEATGKAFAGGWFKSGDTATWLSDGYVKILGRTSVDILKSGGYKLSALEIEEVLRDHPAVSEVAVIGIPDEDLGEACVAAIVPRAGRSKECEASRMRAWAKERVAPYKVPRRVVVLESLPKNALGKVIKPELRRSIVGR